MSGPGVRILWDALPNQSDFFADMIPIRDASLPKQLRDDEAAARRRQYLLVKLGRWLAKLPVSVRLAVGILVNYVRVVERYLKKGLIDEKEYARLMKALPDLADKATKVETDFSSADELGPAR